VLRVEGEGERQSDLLDAVPNVSPESGAAKVVSCDVRSTFSESFGEWFRSLLSVPRSAEHLIPSDGERGLRTLRADDEEVFKGSIEPRMDERPR
jgi:hypothetical protein